jgi:hypothetical protein
VGLLILHGVNHEVPLFLASFLGFLCVLPATMGLPKLRALALRDAHHEFAEYYFLFPLFISVTLLTTAGFFEGLHGLLQQGIAQLGTTQMALVQFFGATSLSAILDNNVVADFASRALVGFEVSVLQLFAMAQIAGYALGGCWTHIGSSQSVVAYAFIQRDVDASYDPVRWMKDITPTLLMMTAAMVAIIIAEGLVSGFLARN